MSTSFPEQKPSWARRHRAILGFSAALLLIGIIGSAPKSAPASNPAAASKAATATPTPGFNAADFYGKVNNGMSKAEVLTLTTKQPTDCNETEISGYGKIENCDWSSFGSESVTVSFTNNAVTTKSKIGF